MKKLLTVLLVCLMAVTLFGCGGGGDKPAPTKTPFEQAKADGKLTIAFVVNGNLGDKSFFDSGDQGIQRINAELGDKAYGQTIELTYDTATWATGLEEAFRAGWDVIIVGTYDMKEYTIPLVEEYPDQKVWFYDEIWNFDDADGWQYSPAKNLYAMMFSQNEGSFVVGAMAAMLTKTNKVAFMGGMDNTVLDDFYVGYAQGAKYINEAVDVNLSWMNSFNDATMGKDVSQGLYAAGYDVVFACGGQAGLGGFDQVITEDEGKWIIGVDGNQGAYFASVGTAEGDKKAERCITSMVKELGVGVYEAAKRELEGTLPYGTNEALGLDGGYVLAAITDTTNKVFTAEQLSTVEKIIADINAGTIKVESAFGHEDGWFTNYVKANDSTK